MMGNGKRAASALVIGLICIASSNATAQVSKTRMGDSGSVSSIGMKAAPEVEEALPASATLIYSNFGTGTNLYNGGTGWTEAGAQANDYLLLEAMSFTPTGDYALVRLDIALQWLQGTNGTKVVLAEDNGGVPGKAIYTVSFTNLPSFGTCCAVQTAKLTPTKTSYVLLKSGQTYWLYPEPADTTSYLVWNYDTTNKGGLEAVYKVNAWAPGGQVTNYGAFDLYGIAVK